LATRRAIPSELLATEKFLVREPGSGTLGVMERFFQDHRIAPKIGMQIASNETIKQAVIAGLGVALISAHTVEAEIEDGRLVILDVTGLPIIRQWHLVHLQDRRLVPAATTLWRFLTDGAGAYLPKVAAQPRGEAGA
jgi:DNA-binding transcriptional LysR family regulator